MPQTPRYFPFLVDVDEELAAAAFFFIICSLLSAVAIVEALVVAGTLADPPENMQNVCITNHTLTCSLLRELEDEDEALLVPEKAAAKPVIPWLWVFEGSFLLSLLLVDDPALEP